MTRFSILKATEDSPPFADTAFRIFFFFFFFFFLSLYFLFWWYPITVNMLESLSDKNKHIAIGAALGIFFTLSTTAVLLATRGTLNNYSGQRRNSQTTCSRKQSRRRSSIGESISKQIALPKAGENSQICDGVAGLIGNTPMMRIKSLSEATGCEILAKAEVL
jgi:cysteine synthase A